MFHKSEFIYNKIFSEIKVLVNKYFDFKIFNNIIFMSDVERGQQKSIKNNFTICIQFGFFFS